MPTLTSNFGLLKPLVNDPTDQDLWGGYLNTDMDDLDGLLKTGINWVKSSQTTSFSITAPTSGSITTGDANKFLLCDATSAAIVASLPTAASSGDGFAVAFKKTDAVNTVTLTPNGSEKIDGASTYVLSFQYDSVILVCHGIGWNVQADKTTVTQTIPAQVPGASSKLIVSWASNTTISLTADYAILNNSTPLSYLASNISLTLNAATTGANGLDTGALGSSSWYYIYLIYNGVSVAGLISLSATTPSLPVGYTYSARVGSALTDGSSHFIGFIQRNKSWQYVVGNNLAALPTMASGSVGFPSAVAIGAYVPIAISSRIRGVLGATGQSASQNVSPNASWTGQYIGTANAVSSSQLLFDFVIETTNIYWGSDDGSAFVRCLGFEDSL